MRPRKAWFALAAAPFLVVVARTHGPVPRCPDGLVARGARCCGEGQTLVDGACAGPPVRCGAGLARSELGCEAWGGRVAIEKGSASYAAPDSLAAAAGAHVEADAFAIDVVEVTWGAYARCVDAGACATIPHAAGGDRGQALFGATLADARAYCAFVGGRVPSDAEWLRAESGEVETRYPWGDPDALCLRAAYGLAKGPCASGGEGPDTAGARPWGATARGLLDLAGNVAEIVVGEVPAGEMVVRGGAWIDEERSDLRPSSRRVVDASARQPWIGFRCAYASP